MEMIHVWALAGALGLAALAATLKAVEFRHELKLENEIVAALRKEIDLLNKKHNESISDTQQLHSAEIEKLTNRINHLESLQKERPQTPKNNLGPHGWMAR